MLRGALQIVVRVYIYMKPCELTKQPLCDILKPTKN